MVGACGGELGAAEPSKRLPIGIGAEPVGAVLEGGALLEWVDAVCAGKNKAGGVDTLCAGKSRPLCEGASASDQAHDGRQD